MVERATESLDVVVIGGNVRGLVTCYLLDRFGYRAVLLERGQSIGGVDRSFVTSDGTTFDHGMHVLDEMRSPLATRLFMQVVDGEVHRVRLRRGIVIRNHVMTYAPRPSEMPDELRRMLPSDNLVDDLGDELPTRDRLARYYGTEFADLIFDEVLPSYPSENRHREFGVDPSRLLANIYPWFFPRSTRTPHSGDESRAFHDRLRSGIDQHILYPKRGGFGGFVDGFLRKLDPDRIEVLTGVDDLHVELSPGTHTALWIDAAGRRFTAPHVFWAGAWALLCGVLGIPCQETATDRVLLGSFRLDRPAITDYHELLFGDPDYRMNRVFFPSFFRRSDEALMQVEYSFPKADPREIDAETWKEIWLADARRCGLIDDDHRVELFDFKTFCMHFNGYGMEGQALVDADPSLVRQDSNIHPVVPSMANLNLNRYVPRTVELVASVLARSGTAR